MEEKQTVSLEVVNPYAAGIDIGSRSHWVAVGQEEDDIREFGVYNEDLFSLAVWLKEKQVKTVAMESTGTYWQNLYAVLIAKDFQVVLCNGKFTKNIKNDICGLTGLKIIRAICSGETDAKVLASYRHYNCRKSETEIAKALQSNGRKDYLFALKQELETYDQLQEKIEQCDNEIEKKLNEIIGNDENKKQHHIDSKPYKRINKNTPKNIDLNLKSYQMFEGNDLLAIEGMSYSTVLSLMSEIGIEGIRKFASAKHFASWLRLAPNNKISGGKVLSSKVPKGSNRLKIALRNAANAIGLLKDSTPLRDFFHRINFRKGRTPL